jgi:glycosyltransferase involved in cell wall biosynthesis
MKMLRRTIWNACPDTLHEWWWYYALRRQFAHHKPEFDDAYREVAAREGDTFGTIIFLMGCNWETYLFQRPHQLARAFASLGYLILFWELDHKGGAGHIEQVEDRLYTCNAFTIPDSEQLITFFAWTPEMRRQIRYLDKPVRFVYDFLDDPKLMCRTPKSRTEHKWMLKNATIVTATADRLVEKASQIRNDIVFCPNAVDTNRFKPLSAVEAPTDIAALMDKPIIGYHGAIAEWLDYDMLFQVVSECKDMNFVVIGPICAEDCGLRGTIEDHVAKLNEQLNFHYLGPKANHDLPAYSSCYTVGIVPFVINDITLSVSPVKLFEYFASGAPAVSTPLPECRKYRSCLIANNANEFSAALRRLVSGDIHKDVLRMEAESNTWVSRAQSILDALA